MILNVRAIVARLPERPIRLAAIDKSGNHVGALERGRINITVNTARQITQVL